MTEILPVLIKITGSPTLADQLLRGLNQHGLEITQMSERFLSTTTQAAIEVHTIYSEFMRQGFTAAQSFELTKQVLAFQLSKGAR